MENLLQLHKCQFLEKFHLFFSEELTSNEKSRLYFIMKAIHLWTSKGWNFFFGSDFTIDTLIGNESRNAMSVFLTS